MNQRHEQRTIVFLVLGCCLTVCISTYWLVKGFSPLLLLPIGGLLLLLFWLLLRVYNSRNRKLSYFFDAIRNEDTTLSFPETVSDKSLRQLHASLNKLNRQIADIKLRNEQNELFFSQLIEQSATGLMAYDEDGYLTVMNGAAKRFLGVAHLANLRLLEQKNPPLHQAVTQLKTGEKVVVKTVVGNEMLTLSIQAADMQFGVKHHRLLSLQDIRHELEESEIDSWQKLIRVMTHEIMNSIAPITSLSHTLLHFFSKQGQPIDPAQLTPATVSDTIEGLTVIEERGNGLIHFVDNYRKLAKVPQPVFGPLDVKTWVQGFTLLFKPTLEQHAIRFNASFAQGIDPIQTDEKLLNQLMINLMTNAIEAVCSKPDGEERCISMQVHPSTNQSVLIELTDNGPGIEDELLDKIFVPFFTTKQGGNGIGLSLSRQLARQLNLKLSVRSQPGAGCTFQLEL